MVYRRSLCSSSSTFNHLLRHRLNLSAFSHPLHGGDDAESQTSSTSALSSPPRPSIAHLHGFDRSAPSMMFRRCFSLPLGFDPSLSRRTYSSSPAVGGGSDGVEYTRDVADVITDTAAEAAVVSAPIANEVAIAAADSFPPVAVLQYFIDGVHNLFGVNWWAAIALSTLFIRTATVPLIVNQLKSTMKLSEMRPELEALKQNMDVTKDPAIAQAQQQRVKELFKE